MLKVMKRFPRRRHLPGFSLAEVGIALIMITTLSIVISQSFTSSLAVTEKTSDQLLINSYATKKLSEYTNQSWNSIPESTKKLNPDGSVAVDGSGNIIYEKPSECINPPELPTEIGPPLNADGTPHNTPTVACQVEVWVAVSDSVLKAVNVRIYYSEQGKGQLFEYNTIFNSNSATNKES